MKDDVIFDAADRLNQSAMFSNNSDVDPCRTSAGRQSPPELLVVICIGVAMCTVIAATLIGNGLVVAAVLTYHRLRSVTNYFVVSLAVADLTVALLVMPYSALFELEDWTTDDGASGLACGGGGGGGGGGWRQWFGWAFCYFWISCDVTCCTSSILHLCVIAVERYLAITEPLTHAGRVSRRRALAVIGAVWTCSLAISFVPIYAGWFAAEATTDTSTTTTPSVIVREVDCALHVNPTYAVISSMTSFYLPLVVMAVVYAKIYRIARRKAGEILKLEQSIGVIRNRSSPADDCIEIHLSECPAVSAADGHHHHHHHQRQQQHAASVRSSRDSKAVKTLGTLMGLFCFCWCPFFVFYLVKPFCPSCDVPAVVVSAITWLGYGNSAVNPFVYAYLNRDFRVAYRRLIDCRRCRGNANRYQSDRAETSWSSAAAAAAAKVRGRGRPSAGLSTNFSMGVVVTTVGGLTSSRERHCLRVPSPIPQHDYRYQLNASSSVVGQMSDDIELHSDSCLRVNE